MVLHRCPVLDSEIAAEYSLYQKILIKCLLGVRFIARYLWFSGEEARTLCALKRLLNIQYSLGGSHTNTKRILMHGMCRMENQRKEVHCITQRSPCQAVGFIWLFVPRAYTLSIIHSRCPKNACRISLRWVFPELSCLSQLRFSRGVPSFLPQTFIKGLGCGRHTVRG